MYVQQKVGVDLVRFPSSHTSIFALPRPPACVLLNRFHNHDVYLTNQNCSLLVAKLLCQVGIFIAPALVAVVLIFGQRQDGPTLFISP